MLARHIAANVNPGDATLFDRAVIGLRKEPRYLNLVEPDNLQKVMKEFPIDFEGFGGPKPGMELKDKESLQGLID